MVVKGNEGGFLFRADELVACVQKQISPKERNGSRSNNCLFIAGFLLFIESIAARKRWYWALQKEAGRVASRLARANKTNIKQKIERQSL